MVAEKVINTKGVRLTPKLNDQVDYFLNLPLRYIAILKKPKGFKHYIPGIDTTVGEKLKSGDFLYHSGF